MDDRTVNEFLTKSVETENLPKPMISAISHETDFAINDESSATQKACLAAKFMPMFSEQAKERKGVRTDIELPGTGAGKFGDARDFASSAFGV